LHLLVKILLLVHIQIWFQFTFHGCWMWCIGMTATSTYTRSIRPRNGL
uniref:Long-wavelength rhodopsin n=1 Tax=Brugia timori TaxID=42155 RepID=A0A0R3R9Y6_9BILA